MSLKIKLPSIKRNDPGMFEEPDTAQQRRRPSNKRAVITSDDEQDHGSPEASSPPPPKRQRLEEDVLPEHEDFDDIDIDIEATAEVEEDEDMEAFPVHTKASKRRIVKPKRFREEDEEDRPQVSKNPPKKKRKSKAKKREHSDAETEDDFDPNAEDLMEDLGTLNDNEDDDFLDDEPKRSSKSKVPPRGKAGPSKGKGIEGTPGPSSSRKPRPRLNVDTDTFVDVGDSQSTSALPTATLESAQPSTTKEPSPLPKKRKLPTIKKNKTATPSTGTPIAATKPVAALKTDTGLPSKTPSGARNQSASTDLDLNNGNIYAELFKKGMQSSSNRREKDEQRRQELNKMRDDARAKRQAEAGETFALQAQMEKILRFEERLRRTGSPALYPNIMAAKMREVYDLDKRRRARETNREELEEGEMS